MLVIYSVCCILDFCISILSLVFYFIYLHTYYHTYLHTYSLTYYRTYYLSYIHILTILLSYLLTTVIYYILYIIYYIYYILCVYYIFSTLTILAPSPSTTLTHTHTHSHTHILFLSPSASIIFISQSHQSSIINPQPSNRTPPRTSNTFQLNPPPTELNPTYSDSLSITNHSTRTLPPHCGLLPTNLITQPH